MDRRRFIQYGGATLLGLGGCGVLGYLAYDTNLRLNELEGQNSGYREQLTAQAQELAESVAEMESLSLTPPATATAIVAAATEQLPELATATATQTSTPEATATPSKEQIRKELVGEIEVNPADGGWSIPAIPTTEALTIWLQNIYIQYQLKNLTQGDIRTAERIDDITEGDLKLFVYNTFSSRVSDENGFGDSRIQSWVPSQATTIEGTSAHTLPLAYEAPSIVVDHAKDVLTTLKGKEPTAQEANDLAKKMQSQLFASQGDGENTILLTRHTYPGDASDRKSQPDKTICSIFTPLVKKGEEYIKDGVFYVSNSNPLLFEFSISQDSEIEVEHPEWLATVPVKDQDGGTHYWRARLFDMGSTPNYPTVFGYGKKDPDGSPMGAQILPHCGDVEVAPEQPEEATSTQRPTLQNTNIPTPSEESTNTPSIPTTTPEVSTLTPTVPSTATPAGTNVHEFPAATSGSAPTVPSTATDIP